MSAKKLLNEMYDSLDDFSILKESIEGATEPTLFITGPFLGANKKNRNGRTYSNTIITREVGGYQPLIESDEAVGELNHPATGEINPERAAIKIVSLKMDGDLAMGKAKVCTHTPCGKTLQGLMLDGIKMGVSSRGTGNLRENGEVADDYHLITIDAVYMPSCPDAYVHAVNETTQWVLDESTNLYIEKKVEIDNATKAFTEKLGKEGSKAIMDAFKEWADIALV